MGIVGSMLIGSRFGSSWERRVRQTMRTMREIREDVQATPVQANKKSTERPRIRKGRRHRLRQRQMLTLSPPSIHSSFRGKQRLYPQDGESVSGQGGVHQVTRVRKCGSTSRSTISTWTAEHVDHARSARIDGGRHEQRIGTPARSEVTGAVECSGCRVDGTKHLGGGERRK